MVGLRVFVYGAQKVNLVAEFEPGELTMNNVYLLKDSQFAVVLDMETFLKDIFYGVPKTKHVVVCLMKLGARIHSTV